MPAAAPRLALLALLSLSGCGGEAGLTILALIVAYGILTGLAGEHDRR